MQRGVNTALGMEVGDMKHKGGSVCGDITLPKGVEVFDLRKQKLNATKQDDPACQGTLAVVHIRVGCVLCVAIASAIMHCLQ